MVETMELEVLDHQVRELEAEGYEVFVRPNRSLIPAFLGDFQPDAIALGGDRNLVIEVVRQSSDAVRKLEKIRELLSNQPKWKLQVVLVEPTSSAKTLQIQDINAIRRRIGEVEQLIEAQHAGSAMLIAWATFEALARVLLTKQFGRPQTPGRLVQVLAGEGYITPSEADKLRALAEKRNRLIHGDLQVEVSEAEIADFGGVLKAMLDQLPE